LTAFDANLPAEIPAHASVTSSCHLSSIVPRCPIVSALPASPKCPYLCPSISHMPRLSICCTAAVCSAHSELHSLKFFASVSTSCPSPSTSALPLPFGCFRLALSSFIAFFRTGSSLASLQSKQTHPSPSSTEVSAMAENYSPTNVWSPAPALAPMAAACRAHLAYLPSPSRPQPPNDHPRIQLAHASQPPNARPSLERRPGL
jgi:hypothetical protein